MPPFVLKMRFYEPSKENKIKNVNHAIYIATKPEAELGSMEIGDSPLDKSISQEISHDSAVSHAQYSAERPGSFGLFGEDEYAPPILANVLEELKEYEGIVWRGILSFREDDAQRLGLTERSSWERGIRACIVDAADKMGIPPSNLKWTAAFHAKEGHPHVHLLFWENQPTRMKGQLSKGELKDFKKTFITEFYKEERSRLNAEKTALRDLIKDQAKTDMKDIMNLIKEVRSFENEIISLNGKVTSVPPILRTKASNILLKSIQELSEMMPEKGRIALAYMPSDVKEKVRGISDWVLEQPGFKKSVLEYKNTASQLAGYYDQTSGNLNLAKQKAYEDIRDRVSQDILKNAAEYRKLHVNNLEYLDLKTNQIMDTYLSVSDDELFHNGTYEIKEKEYEIYETLWRSNWRLIERERVGELDEGYKIITQLSNEQIKDLDILLKLLANDMPELKTKPSYFGLSEELKNSVNKIADWFLEQNIFKESINEFNNSNLVSKGKIISDQLFDKLHKELCENIVNYSSMLKPRESIKFEILTHQERVKEALDKLPGASFNVVKNDIKESEWTTKTLYRTYVKLGLDENTAKIKTIEWAKKANVINYNELIKKENSKMLYIERKCIEQGKEAPINISKKDWIRMRENLGFREDELLTPWFARLKRDANNEINNVNKYPIPEINQENVSKVLNALSLVSSKPMDFNELQWTVNKFIYTLRELGVDRNERDIILLDWCKKANINISTVRIKDMADSISLNDRTFFLGGKNWNRFLNNLGLDKNIENPWKLNGYLSDKSDLSQKFIKTTWKSLWKGLEKERHKVQAQGENIKQIEQEKQTYKAKIQQLDREEEIER